MRFSRLLHKVRTASSLSPQERVRVARVRASQVAPRLFLGPREALAKKYLSGTGIEVGALHHPMPVPKGVTVQYVDFLSHEELCAFYTYLDPDSITRPDFVGDGETLSMLDAEMFDFVVANHFLEHTQNPLATLENFLRVVRPGGIVFITVPDKRFTFDQARAITPFCHVLRDYREGPEWSAFGHYDEWLEIGEGITDPVLRHQRAREMEAARAELHFHVWDEQAFAEFTDKVPGVLSLPARVQEFLPNREENIAVLRKL